MGLTVWAPFWWLEEDRRVIGEGEEVAFDLILDVATDQRAGGLVQRITGLARPFPASGEPWAGGNPVRIDAGGAALFWEAPAPVEGPVTLDVVISVDVLADVPSGFPSTVGVVRRVRMAWSDPVQACGDDESIPPPMRFEDVQATYLPSYDSDDPRSTQPSTASLEPLGDETDEFVVTTESAEPPADPAKGFWAGVALELEVTGLR